MVTPDMGIDLFNRTRWIKMTCLEFCLRPRETKSVYLYIDRMCIYCDDWKVDISYVRWMCAFLCGLCTLFEVIVCDVSDSMTLGSNSVFPTFSNSFSPFSAINHMDVSEFFHRFFVTFETATNSDIHLFSKCSIVCKCIRTNERRQKQTRINPSYKSCRILFRIQWSIRTLCQWLSLALERNLTE